MSWLCKKPCVGGGNFTKPYGLCNSPEMSGAETVYMGLCLQGLERIH